MVDSARGQRAEPEAVGPARRRMSRVDRAARRREEQNKRRRRVGGRVALALFVVVMVVAVFVGTRLWNTVFGSGDDYSGNGKRDIVIHVQDGDSTTMVGETLHSQGVVATVRAFVNA